MNSKWLIVGLGNPELKYEKNRHNIGFLVMDYSFNKLEKETVKNKYKNNTNVYFMFSPRGVPHWGNTYFTLLYYFVFILSFSALSYFLCTFYVLFRT